ncbi:DMT family transporter [Kurthia sibirica]|uniref:EamA family transporter n=1 Tax=Kurthia sibirica TaxID=202750 RepID=A0A2U3APS0_9BACL|nr:DMT family transporter [Kurthia sibirica]PWI26550.1 EamA family transporter [Kurthia sibirica]GEK32799.1 transporter [Kurthia sibirica]
MKERTAVMMLMLTAIVWGSGFVMTDIGLVYLSPYQLMAGRFILAAIILISIFSYKLKNINKKVLIKGAILGTILYTGFVLQTVGLQYTTPSKNAFLTAVNVLIVPLIAFVIYKRKFDRFEMIGAFAALIGIGLLSLESSFTMNIGDVLTLLCAVAFAFDIFYTNKFVQKEDAILLTVVQFIVAAILSVIFMLLFDHIPTSIEAGGIYSIVYLAIFSTIIAYLLQNIAFQYTTATKAAIILSMEALFGMIFSVLFLSELLTFRMVIGAFLILLAIIIAEVKPTFRKKQANLIGKLKN